MGKEYKKLVWQKSNIGAPIGPIGFEDFEDGFYWVGMGNGADYMVEKSSDLARSGAYSLHVKTKATGPAIDDYAGAYRYLSPRPEKRLRFLAFPINPSGSETVDIVLRLDVYLDGTLHQALLIWDLKNRKIGYWDSAGDTVWSDAYDLDQVAGQISEMELVIDMFAQEYEIIRVNHIRLNLSGVSYKAAATASNKSEIEAYIGIQNNDANQGEMYFDDVLVENPEIAY